MPAPCYVNAHCGEVYGVSSQLFVLLYVHGRLLLFAVNNSQLMLLIIFLMKFEKCSAVAILLPRSSHFRRTFNFLYATRKENGGSCLRYAELRKGWAHVQGISEGNVGCVPHTELATYAHIWSSTCTQCRWFAIAQIISTRHVQILLTPGIWKSWSYGQSVIYLLFDFPNPEILSEEERERGRGKEDIPDSC